MSLIGTSARDAPSRAPTGRGSSHIGRVDQLNAQPRTESRLEATDLVEILNVALSTLIENGFNVYAVNGVDPNLDEIVVLIEGPLVVKDGGIAVKE